MYNLIKMPTFIGTLSFLISLSAFAASPAVNEIKCLARDSKTAEIGNLQFRLRSPAKSEKILCQKISWKGKQFLSLRYITEERVSYSGKDRQLQTLDVFEIENKKAVYKFSEPIESLKALWMEAHGHLVLRLQDKGTDGAAVLLNGYVYLPDRKSFVDYKLHAFDNNWKD